MSLIKRNMRLFGLPYQFLDTVDPIIPTVSNTVGRKFAENIILDAPVVTIIPGKPKYLPGSKDKYTTAQAMISAANDSLAPLQTIITDKNSSNEIFRYYDFERSYTEYIKYVNILCRTCAAFLEIDEKIDGVSCQRYDYSKYKWSTDSENGNTMTEKILNSWKPSSSSLNSKVSNKKDVNVKSSDTSISAKDTSTELKYETTSSNVENEETIEDLMTSHTYVQFFIDSSDMTYSESASNATAESKIKSALDSGSDMLKELAFVVNSSGVADSANLQEFTDSALQSIADMTGGITDSSSITGALSRVLSLTSNIAKGENVIMPDIYQNSSYEKQYSFTVHLKSPYGTKFGYFMEICVPLMHLLALGIPKQTTANTYGAPFLIKAYCEGIFTCNLGIVTSISISKGINSAFSVDGLPTEVDVSVSISDLYSDLSMSPQSSPILFINNDSLIEYLATTCGLSLVSPNINARLSMIVDAVTNAFSDIDNTIVSSITEAIDKFTLNFLGLSW